ncbi:MAG TPA: S8 family serine peptidase [Thermoanaerobaculia bacterium]|nr:S8 family serine peptidase [Thermoanaerobaculia bacterium]
MSIRTTLGAAAIAAVVIGSLGTLVPPPRFPELAYHSRKRARRMIVDPRLRPRNGEKDAEARYEAAINALIAAQKRLSQARAPRGVRRFVDIDKLRTDMRTAEARAIAARPYEWSAPLIETRTLLLLFDRTATQAQITNVLLNHRLHERSRVQAISFLVVDVEDNVDDESESGSIERESSLLWARIDELKEEESVLQVAVVNLPLYGMTIPSQQWAAANPSLVLIRFPQAWNFKKVMDPGSDIVDVGVLDEGFANTNAATPVNDLPMTFPGPCFGGGSNHGTQVAGVIGATWGNGIATDGAAPHVNLVGCVSATTAEMPAALETLFTNSSNLRVINASLGYNWRKATSQVEQDVAADHGAIVRAAMQGHSNVVLVSSAGNDCDHRKGCADPATYASPFNWAALGPSADLPPSENVIVVQALDGKMKRLSLSNVSPMMGAIGEGLQTIFSNASSGTMAPSTSAAAPLVSATVAMMLEIDPKLPIADIKRNLGVPAGTLDAYKALLASSKTPDRDLADRNGDGNVDMLDFAIFKRSFHLSAADQKFDECDFDGDGHVDRDDLRVMMRSWTDTSIDPGTLPGQL